jgi:hypothetical protein
MLTTTSSSRHAELIDSLQELYTLIGTLGAFPTLENEAVDAVQLPPHEPGALNAAAASEAGYAPDAVELMGALPYLTVAGDDYADFELLPSTRPSTYLGEDRDAGHFEWMREMDVNDDAMSATALRLTRSNVYGVVWVYDVETCELVPFFPSLPQFPFRVLS